MKLQQCEELVKRTIVVHVGFLRSNLKSLAVIYTYQPQPILPHVVLAAAVWSLLHH